MNKVGLGLTLAELENHWLRSLEAQLKAANTIRVYRISVDLAVQHWARMGLPDRVDAIHREHVEDYLADLASRRQPATVQTYYRGLRSFFGWLAEEGEIPASPMLRVRAPRQPQTDPRGLTVDQVKRLISICDRGTFTGRRDAALIAFCFDTGWRISEVLRVTVDMVRPAGELRVQAKGRKMVQAALAPQVQSLVDRYIRARRSARPELWLSEGDLPLTAGGARWILRRRGEQAGLGRVHPHMLRHAHALAYLREGGNVMDLKVGLGHASVNTTERYTKYMEVERALAARDRYGPGRLL